MIIRTIIPLFLVCLMFFGVYQGVQHTQNVLTVYKSTEQQVQRPEMLVFDGKYCVGHKTLNSNIANAQFLLVNNYGYSIRCTDGRVFNNVQHVRVVKP